MNRLRYSLKNNLEIAVQNGDLTAIDKISKMLKDTELSYVNLLKNKDNNKNIPVVITNNPICSNRGDLIYEKSCKCANGRIWECKILGKVVERLCNKENCNGFILKENNQL